MVMQSDDVDSDEVAVTDGGVDGGVDGHWGCWC